MARTPGGTQLTETHRQAQIQVRARALQAYLVVWPLWTGDDESFERLVQVALLTIRAHHGLSRALASAYFRAFRTAEQVTGDAIPRLAPSLDEAVVAGTLHVTGRDMTGKAIAAGKPPHEARQAALVRTSGTVTRFALQGGRDTLILSTAADRQAKGWTRVTDGAPCAFCAMLASRGPSYSESGADFQAHDHCSCAAEPAYEGSEWPGRAREFRELYNQHAAGSDNPVNEMRKALAA